MPRISEFYGILIIMNFGDHAPPHFHVRYGEHRVPVGIDPIRVLRGQLPARIQSLVFEWAALHRHELEENWRLASTFQPVVRIQPLP